jgi:hypothetical protein
MGNTVHVLSAAHNLELMKKAQATVQLGARLLLVDHWTDPTHSQSLLRRLCRDNSLASGRPASARRCNLVELRV